MDATISTPRSLGDDRLDAIEERIRPIGSARLGVLLQQLRETRNVAFDDIVLVPQLRTELEAIEAGVLRPDASLVEALLRGYHADLDDLVPPRATLVVTEGSDEEVLTRYLVAVRSARRSTKHPVLRAADVKVLAGILGSGPDDIGQRLHTHAIEERIAPLSTARLGVLVRKLRASTRSNRNVATPLALTESQLEDIEAGRLRPDTATVASLLSYCDVDIDALVPPRQALAVTGADEKELLTRYLGAMRRWRGAHKPGQLREADLQALAGMLGSNPADIRRRLRKLTGCSRRRARWLTATLLTGMAVAPAAATLLHSSGAQATATVQKEALPSSTELAGATSAAPVSAATAVPTSAATAATAAVNAAAVHTVAADCATALAYLSAHAKPGFIHYCRPGDLKVGITNAVAYTCVPGPTFACPDGHAEIIIADPGCAATYENEASNSYWNFSTGTVIQPGATQDGRTWDPYGECP